MPDIGCFLISPGGEGVDDLLADLNGLRLELKEQLSELGVDSIELAQQQLATRMRLTMEVEQSARNYDRVAPKGIDALQESLSKLEADRSQHRASPIEQTVLQTVAELESAVDMVAEEVDALETSINCLTRFTRV